MKEVKSIELVEVNNNGKEVLVDEGKSEEKNKEKKKISRLEIILISFLFICIIGIILLVVNYYDLKKIIKAKTDENEGLSEKLKTETNKTQELEERLKTETDENEVLKKKLEKKNKKASKFYNVIPCFVRSYYQGFFDFCSNGLKKMSEDKYKYFQEEHLQVNIFQNDKLYQSIGNIEDSIVGNIALFRSKGNLKVKIEKLQNEKYSSSSMVYKKILGSIRLNKKDISLNKELLNKIYDIVNNNLTNESKAEKLEEIFQEYGYYIPLTFYLGGMLIMEMEDLKSNNNKNKNIDGGINFNYNDQIQLNASSIFYDRNIGEKSISRLMNTIIGGNTNVKTIDEWRFSLNKSNSNIIGIDDVIDITKLFNETLNKKLKEPLQIFKKKLDNRRQYYENYETIRKIKLKEKYQNNDEEGI